MILQAETNCWLTEAADVKPEDRHFALTVKLSDAKEAGRWRQVTDAEKEKLLQQGTVFDVDQLNGEYLDKVDTLLAAIPARINEAAPLPTADALAHLGYYPAWGDENAPMGKKVEPGFRMRNNGKLYEVIQAHALQEQWSPGAKDTESLYKVVVLDHAGTADDPIPYDGNMELVEGKYYTQDGATYLCTRSTGQPVYHTLAGLVGQYVEKAEAPSTEEEEQE